MSKYGARKTVIDNITFDSAAEARRYQQLVILVRTGAITDLEVHPIFVLIPKRGRESQIKHIPDFQYYDTENGRWVVEDVKGVETDVWRIKRRLFVDKYPDIEYRVIQAKDV